MKKVVVSVTNDLVIDQRVQRSISALQEMGYSVHFVGRLLPGSLQPNFTFPYTRFKLWFNKGFLFYANYNLRLFWFLLWLKADVYLSNDLDTLLPNTLVARFRGKPLVYDSHEYFLGVPEIQHRPAVKKVWKVIEWWCVPKADAHITVNESIANLYAQDYGIPFSVVRNIGKVPTVEKQLTRKDLGLPEDAFLLINQGSGINVDRGMEEMLEALPLLPEKVKLVLVGNGDALPLLKEKTKQMGLQKRVLLVPKQPYQRLLQYTSNADCGLSLDKDTNVNYRYSLPNKLFDYINSGIPLVVSNVVEVSDIVSHYQIGEVTATHAPESLSEAITRVMKTPREAYREGLRRAARENTWENEKETFKKVFERLN